MSRTKPNKIIPQGSCEDCGKETYCIVEIREAYLYATEECHDLSIFEEWLMRFQELNKQKVN